VKAWAVAAWLLIWHGLSAYVGQGIILPSPASVAERLVGLASEPSYWFSVLFSLSRIVAGFVLASAIGVAAASLSSWRRRVGDFLAPAIAAVKSTPVASVTVLALLWIPSRNLSVFVSFVTVFPIVYSNVRKGLSETDSKLLEMAWVFSMPARRKATYIYLPQTLPYYQAACLAGLGMCWKAGVAAEVIGLPDGSVGERLYLAKLYFATPDMFAWTLTVIAASVAFERLFMALVRLLAAKVGGAGKAAA